MLKRGESQGMPNLIGLAWWVLLIGGIIMTVLGWKGLQEEVPSRVTDERDIWTGKRLVTGGYTTFKFRFGGCLALLVGLVLFVLFFFVWWKFGNLSTVL